jgi:hypothetical protein
VALFGDVVELEQPPDPQWSHHVRDPRDVDEKSFEAALEEHPASHGRRVLVEEGSCVVGQTGSQVLVDFQPIARGPHPHKREEGLIGERPHGRDLEFEQMVLGGVHVDRHDLLRAIVNEVEHAPSARGDAEHAFSGADPQRFQLTIGVFVA